VLAVAERDLRVVVRSRAVVVPAVVVPVVVLLIPPLTLLIAASAPAALAIEMEPLLLRLPDALVAQLPTEPGQQAVVLLLVYAFAPLFLLVPVLVAGVTAADSVVGERERGTLEGLLQTPTTDRELFLGKLLAPWVVAMVVAVVSAVAYGALANVVLRRFGLPPSFPNVVWGVLVAWVTPATAGLALGLIVAVSARVDTFQEASQIAGVIVLPIAGLVIAQVAGLVLFDAALVAALGGAVWLLTLLLLRIAGRSFSRDHLLSRG
jgi:ABC-type Na+ efflux pump permease subunit